MLKITAISSYPKLFKNGKQGVVFVYAVNGPAEEIEQYKADRKASGIARVENEEGVALWFTTRSAGNAGTLVKTSKGEYIADMSAFRQAESLAKQFGGSLGEELARQAVAILLGVAPTPTSAQNKPVEKQEGDADLGQS